MITEEEVVAAVLETHGVSAAEKFIQEVCWRTYWKGWLQQRPQVWTDYLGEVVRARSQSEADAGLAARLDAARRGETGLECFDAWARELTDTGYLHNHARMWFASIWIFTLRLPWVLGAEFFLRHLLDGDPAANTLSWRWVGGLHTRGKFYLVQAENINSYTEGRFHPADGDLAASAQPLGEAAAEHERIALSPAASVKAGTEVVLLLTEDDLSPETWPISELDVRAVAIGGIQEANAHCALAVRAFKAGALADAGARAALRWNVPVRPVSTPVELFALARESGAKAVVTALVPVGHLGAEIDRWTRAGRAEGIPLLQIARRWDELFWPHATAGFFRLRKRIPDLLAQLDLLPKTSSR